LRVTVRAIASFALGVLLLVPVSFVYGLAGLPVYHSWGLAHGSFTTAIPALTAASFLALGLITWFGPTTDVVPRIVASVLVLPLVTIMFWVNQSSSYRFSMWHGVVYVVVFGLLLALCISAKRPFLVPLFLVVPLLVDPVFGLLITGFYSFETALQLFVHDVFANVLPVLIAGIVASFVARYVRPSAAS